MVAPFALAVPLRVAATVVIAVAAAVVTVGAPGGQALVIKLKSPPLLVTPLLAVTRK